MASETSKLEQRIGVKTVTEDIVTPTQIHRLNITLNCRDPLPKEGDPVPRGWLPYFFRASSGPKA